MVKIKFCGLFREEDIFSVNRFRPDYAGFVFYEKSHRNVGREQAFRLKQLLDKSIKAVGVFVDKDPEYIASLAEQGIIDMIQLHGNEDEGYIRSLRSLTKAEVIRAYQLQSGGSAEENRSILNDAIDSPADYILIDSGKGTGRTFDWSLLKELKRPYFLAGGLDRDNIKEALDTLYPYCLDISSGIETYRKKDPEKMKEIINIVHEREESIE